MNQEITISASTICYLHDEELRPFNKLPSRLLEVFEQNYLVSDDKLEHFRLIIDTLEGLPDTPVKEALTKFVHYWIQERKRFVKTNSLNIDDISLAKISDDKIYFNPFLGEKEIKKNVIKNPEIEFHNSTSFIQPETTHRLKNCPSYIKLEKGCYYDIVKILLPFLKNSCFIKIIDPYLPNCYAQNNLKKIFCMNACENYELSFLVKESYIEKRVDENKIKNFESLTSFIKLHKEKGIKIIVKEIRKKVHLERYIYTDIFKIYIPGGLDFLDSDGYYNGETGELRIEYNK